MFNTVLTVNLVMEYETASPGHACYILMPMPVTLIVTKRPDEGYNAMTASWIMPLSRNPPLLAVAIAPRRFTYECLKLNPEFTVCILPPEMQDIAWYCGTVSGRNENKINKLIREGKIKLLNLSRVKVPGIEGSLAIIGCKLWKDYDGGDHRVIIGEIVECLVRKGKFRETWTSGTRLLYYYGGSKFLKVEIQ